MKPRIEKQTTYIIRKGDGNLDLIMIRGDVAKHSRCNVDHTRKLGDEIFWEKCDMYMTKAKGLIIEFKHNDWDYSMPMGLRAINVEKSALFDSYLKDYRESVENKNVVR